MQVHELCLVLYRKEVNMGLHENKGDATHY
jgi:hypothetical protein